MTFRSTCIFRWLLGLALAATLVLSLLPPSGIPQVLSFWDKAQHALGFAVLAWLAAASGLRWRNIALGLLVWGALIEVLQSLTTWRQGDVWDWVADAIGIAFGLALSRLWTVGSTIRS